MRTKTLAGLRFLFLFVLGLVVLQVSAQTNQSGITHHCRTTGTPYRAGDDIAWQVPSDARLKDVTGSYSHGLEELTRIQVSLSLR